VAKEMMDLAFETSLFTLQSDFLHALKTYNMGPMFATSLLKESMLRIFISFKNPSPWPNLNPRTLNPMASMLTISPLKRLIYSDPLALLFLRKVVKSYDVFGTCSSGNLLVLVNTITAIMPPLC
jgi:hypothetical protein